MQNSEETEKEKEQLRVVILPQEGRALHNLGGSLLGCLFFWMNLNFLLISVSVQF